MEILATTSFGLEAVLKRELEKLGYSNPKAYDGKVHIQGNLKDIARLNINLRTADRVLLKLAEFKATTFDELFAPFVAMYYLLISSRLESRRNCSMPCNHRMRLCNS